MKGCFYNSVELDCQLSVMHPEGLQSLWIIRDLIAEMKPELMIELGTAYGGFTAVMLDGAPNAKFYTVDRVPGEQMINRSGGVVTETDCIQWRKAMKRKGVEFLYQDLITEPCGKIENLCSDGRKKFVYMDNGNKPFEVAFYGPHLNPGDVMGVHDWKKEIWPDQPPVKTVLEHHFREHTVNDKLRDRRSLSRFFVRK
jgi:cephalosporin hydroxylase